MVTPYKEIEIQRKNATTPAVIPVIFRNLSREQITLGQGLNKRNTKHSGGSSFSPSLIEVDGELVLDPNQSKKYYITDEEGYLPFAEEEASLEGSVFKTKNTGPFQANSNGLWVRSINVWDGMREENTMGLLKFFFWKKRL